MPLPSALTVTLNKWAAPEARSRAVVAILAQHPEFGVWATAAFDSDPALADAFAAALWPVIARRTGLDLAPALGLPLAAPAAQAAPQASAPTADLALSGLPSAGPTGSYAIRKARKATGLDGRQTGAAARREQAELAVLAVLAAERGPMQFGQVVAAAAAAGLARLAAEKAIHRLVDLGHATKTGGRAHCPVTITEAGRLRHRAHDAATGDRRAFSSSLRAACCRVLNDGRRHPLTDFLQAVTDDGANVQATIDDLLRERLIGVSVSGPARLYQRRGAQAIA